MKSPFDLMLRKYYRPILLALFVVFGGAFYGSLGMMSFYARNPALTAPGGYRVHNFHYGAKVFYLDLNEAMPIWMLRVASVLVFLIIFSLMVYMKDTRWYRYHKEN
jgi:hypothetical protein